MSDAGECSQESHNAAAEPTTSSPAAAVVRAYSAEDVGKHPRIKKNPRTVRRWTEPGGLGGAEPCPCERRQRGKETVLRFNLDEVLDWCTRHGVELVDPDAVPATPMFELVDTPRADPAATSSATAGPTVAELLADVPIGEERAAFRGTLADLRRQVNSFAAAVREKNLAGLSHSQIKQLTEAAAKASQEIRQIDDADLDLRKRRGELVEKTPERRAWGQLAGDLVALLTRLEVDVATEGKMLLAEKGCLTPEAAGEGEMVERIIRDVVRRVCDAERTRLAAVLTAAAGISPEGERKEAA